MSKCMKSNLSIKEIKITKHELYDLKSKLKKSSINSNGSNDIIKKYAGGVCVVCGTIPSKLITRDAQCATVVERYCDDCFKNWDNCGPLPN